MAISPNVVPAIVLLPSEMVGGAPQLTTAWGNARSIVANFRGVKIGYFPGQTDPDENFTHENLGVIYRNACNAVHVRNEKQTK